MYYLGLCSRLQPSLTDYLAFGALVSNFPKIPAAVIEFIHNGDAAWKAAHNGQSPISMVFHAYGSSDNPSVLVNLDPVTNGIKAKASLFSALVQLMLLPNF